MCSRAQSSLYALPACKLGSYEQRTQLALGTQARSLALGSSQLSQSQRHSQPWFVTPTPALVHVTVSGCSHGCCLVRRPSCDPVTVVKGQCAVIGPCRSCPFPRPGPRAPPKAHGGETEQPWGLYRLGRTCSSACVCLRECPLRHSRIHSFTASQSWPRLLHHSFIHCTTILGPSLGIDGAHVLAGGQGDACLWGTEARPCASVSS